MKFSFPLFFLLFFTLSCASPPENSNRELPKAIAVDSPNGGTYKADLDVELVADDYAFSASYWLDFIKIELGGNIQYIFDGTQVGVSKGGGFFGFDGPLKVHYFTRNDSLSFILELNTYIGENNAKVKFTGERPIMFGYSYDHLRDWYDSGRAAAGDTLTIEGNGKCPDTGNWSRLTYRVLFEHRSQGMVATVLSEQFHPDYQPLAEVLGDPEARLVVHDGIPRLLKYGDLKSTYLPVNESHFNSNGSTSEYHSKYDSSEIFN